MSGRGQSSGRGGRRQHHGIIHAGLSSHCYAYTALFWQKEASDIQSTLPKSNSHKSNNCLSRRSFPVLFSSFSIVNCLLLHLSKFCLSRSYFFSPNGFDLGKVDCTI